MTLNNNQPNTTPDSTGLSLCQLNCRSLLPRFSHLEQMILTEWKCEIVCLSETWLSSAIPNSFLFIPSFSLFRHDRPQGKHGGLLVYASSHLGLQRRADLEDPDIECIVLELSLHQSGRFLISFCYQPPSYPPGIFFNRLWSAISKDPPASSS